MGKKLTIEVTDQVHQALVRLQDEKKKQVKAKVPLAVIAADVLEDALIKGKG